MRTVDSQSPANHTIPDLFKRLRDESATLFRQEVELAKVEMSEKASRVGRNIAYLAIGGLVAYAGAMLLLLGLSRLVLLGLQRIGVAHDTALWIAPMIVGVIVAAIGYGFVQKAISTLKRERVAPEKTVQTLQENKEWLKEKIH